MRCKDVVNTALAMTTAHGIALAVGWNRPIWAGLAFATVDRSTVSAII